MLLKDAAQRAQLIHDMASVAALPTLSDERKALVEQIVGSVEDPDFPGAVLLTAHSKRFAFYAVAETGLEWRELAPLLVASIGVTTTNFTGRAHQIASDDPIMQLLGPYDLFAVSRFTAYGDQKREQHALQAIARLRTLVKGAAAQPRTFPRSTSQALYDFHAALGAGDRQAAESVLAFLREGMRIDALNHTFLEIRLDETFGDWNRLVTHDAFQSLCLTRRPPAITAAMAEALYQTRIARAEEQDDPRAALDLFRREALDQSGTLFTICPPAPTPAVGKAFLLAGLATATLDSVLLERLDVAARSWPERQARFYYHLRALAPGDLLAGAAPSGPSASVVVSPTPPTSACPELPSEHVRVDNGSGVAHPGIEQFDYESQLATAHNDQEPPTLQRAQATLSAALNVASLSAYQTALAYVARLDDATRRRLLAKPLMRPLWENMSQYATSAGQVPRDWREWIELLPEMSPTQASQWADAAINEHPIREQLKRPEDVSALVEALIRAPSIAIDRLFETAPTLVEWVEADAEWPNPLCRSLYRQLFELLLLSSNRSPNLYKALSVLLTGMLSVGLSATEYDGILHDLGSMAPELSGARDLDWLCDLAEMTVVYPCPSNEARTNFWSQLLAIIAQYGSRLTMDQRRVLTEVGDVLGLAETLAMLPPAPATSAVTFSRRLGHHLVGIYTLTEGVGERVARILGDEYSSIEVRVNHDHVSTQQLRDLAKRADVFIVCWLSAKHSATGAILQERPRERKTIYAPGKGSSSICREVRAYLDQLEPVMNLR